MNPDRAQAEGIFPLLFLEKWEWRNRKDPFSPIKYSHHSTSRDLPHHNKQGREKRRHFWVQPEVFHFQKNKWIHLRQRPFQWRERDFEVRVHPKLCCNDNHIARQTEQYLCSFRPYRASVFYKNLSV